MAEADLKFIAAGDCAHTGGDRTFERFGIDRTMWAFAYVVAGACHNETALYQKNLTLFCLRNEAGTPPLIRGRYICALSENDINCGFRQFFAESTLVELGNDGAFQLVTFVQEG